MTEGTVVYYWRRDQWRAGFWVRELRRGKHKGWHEIRQIGRSRRRIIQVPPEHLGEVAPMPAGKENIYYEYVGLG